MLNHWPVIKWHTNSLLLTLIFPLSVFSSPPLSNWPLDTADPKWPPTMSQPAVLCVCPSPTWITSTECTQLTHLFFLDSMSPGRPTDWHFLWMPIDNQFNLQSVSLTQWPALLFYATLVLVPFFGTCLCFISFSSSPSFFSLSLSSHASPSSSTK